MPTAALKLTKKEQSMFDYLMRTPKFRNDLAWRVSNAHLDNRTAQEETDTLLNALRRCARIVVKNPTIAIMKIYDWWFCHSTRKPYGLVLA